MLICPLINSAYPQNVGGSERSDARMALRTLKNYIKDNFYDPNFRGIDIEGNFKEAQARINEAQSEFELNAIIGQFVLALNEPNTLFAPPIAYSIIDYGWDWLMVGDKCYVTSVKPGSDAEVKSLKIGDEILSIGRYKLTRDDAWKIKYVFFMLQPQSKLQIIVRQPGNQPKLLEVQSERMIKARFAREGDFFYQADKLRQELKAQKVEINSDLLVWKLFGLSSEPRIGEVFKKAKDYRSLIIDLRGCREALKNSFDNQSSQDSINKLREIVGYLFDRDLKIADLKKREDQKPILAKPRGENAFKGKLVVIVDNETSSTSEIFSRVIQLEKRGTIIGDKTKGTTRLSSGYTYVAQTSPVSSSWYGLIIAERELIMSDGQSLDGMGIIPDEVVLPNYNDLANNRDPVLSRAAAILGVQISPEKAGMLLRRPHYTLWMN